MLSHPSPQGVRGILAALSLCMLLSSLGISIANVGLPALATAFHASFQAVQWVLLCYLLAVTTCIIGIGRLGDSLNRRRLLLAGIALFTAASLACALAPQLWLLLAARLAQGLGGAVMMSITMALAGEALGTEKIGRAMGLLGTMSAVGTALGPSLGGTLIAGFGWRAMFLINLPLGLLALWLAWRYLPNGARAATRPEPFDRAGTLLLGGALLCYSLAMTLGRGDFGALNLALMLGALLAAGLFIRVERRAVSPLLAPTMFRHPALTAGLAASALVMTVMTATLVVGPFYLARAGVKRRAGGAGDVGRAGGGDPDRYSGGLSGGSLWIATHRPAWAGGSGRRGGIAVAAGPLGRTRLCRADRAVDRRLCAVSGGQQHGADEGSVSRTTRVDRRHGQSGAQSGGDHRRVGDGGAVLSGLAAGGGRRGGRGLRHARHLRRGGVAGVGGIAYRLRRPPTGAAL